MDPKLRFSRTKLGLGIVVLLYVLVPRGQGLAAMPSSGSISSASGPVVWDFGPVVAGTPIDITVVESTCPPGACDNYDLMVVLPAPAATYYQTNTAKLSIHYSWTSSVPTDLDIFAFSPTGAKHGPGSPDTTASGPNYEDLVLTDPIDGVWHIRSVASTVPIPTGAHAVATLTVGPRPTIPPPPPPGPGAPSFVNYPAPESITPATGSTTAGQHGAGEPSIGVSWITGKVFIEAGNHTLRVAFDDTATPAAATWADKRSPFARVSLDPILWTDSAIGRTFESQLDGACSVTSFTDNDGELWVASTGCGVPAGPDHQTLGGGPYAIPAPIHAYPNAIYYCSQGIAAAICARSDDGGVSFGAGIPIYNLTQCGGLHGHVKVAPDGAAYVPNSTCGGKDGFAVSTDNGLTWAIRTVPDSVSNRNGGDPSIGIGAKGALYFGYVNGDGHAKIAVTRDRGLHWTKSVDVGTPFGVQNAEFSEVVAGDDDRATFAFLGTPRAGDTQSSDFLGVWHLYVATTYDGGTTWTTVDATPADPVQRGCIWNGGGSNPCRNLLDFNDITVDKVGRVLIGYADGCTGACVTNPSANTYDALATIARQVGGRGLFAAYDGTSFGLGGGGDGGGGTPCAGRPNTGVSGDVNCNDHDADDD